MFVSLISQVIQTYMFEKLGTLKHIYVCNDEFKSDGAFWSLVETYKKELIIGSQ